METKTAKKKTNNAPKLSKNLKVYRLNRGGIDLTYRVDKNGNKILLTLI